MSKTKTRAPNPIRPSAEKRTELVHQVERQEKKKETKTKIGEPKQDHRTHPDKNNDQASDVTAEHDLQCKAQKQGKRKHKKQNSKWLQQALDIVTQQPVPEPTRPKSNRTLPIPPHTQPRTSRKQTRRRKKIKQPQPPQQTVHIKSEESVLLQLPQMEWILMPFLNGVRDLCQLITAYLNEDEDRKEFDLCRSIAFAQSRIQSLVQHQPARALYGVLCCASVLSSAYHSMLVAIRSLTHEDSSRAGLEHLLHQISILGVSHRLGFLMKKTKGSDRWFGLMRDVQDDDDDSDNDEDADMATLHRILDAKQAEYIEKNNHGNRFTEMLHLLYTECTTRHHSIEFYMHLMLQEEWPLISPEFWTRHSPHSLTPNRLWQTVDSTQWIQRRNMIMDAMQCIESMIFRWLRECRTKPVYIMAFRWAQITLVSVIQMQLYLKTLNEEAWLQVCALRPEAFQPQCNSCFVCLCQKQIRDGKDRVWKSMDEESSDNRMAIVTRWCKMLRSVIAGNTPIHNCIYEWALDRPALFRYQSLVFEKIRAGLLIIDQNQDSRQKDTAMRKK